MHEFIGVHFTCSFQVNEFIIGSAMGYVVMRRKLGDTYMCAVIVKNVKCTLVRALRLCTGRTANRGSRGIALLFLDHGTRRCERPGSRPGRSLSSGKTRYPLYRRLGGPQGRSGQVRKMSPPPGFDPRTVQPVASRYTVYATRPTYAAMVNTKICSPCQPKISCFFMDLSTTSDYFH